MDAIEGLDYKEVNEAFNLSSFHAGFLKLAILKLVSQRPLHGYALMKEIERMSEGTWRPSPGSIYPALQDLLGSGYIAQQLEGRKRIYTITPHGDTVLRFALDHLRVSIRNLGNLLEYQTQSE
ncbi:MAG: PadR family transcriptional regulator [Methanomassiliicoccus sp.]|nr:PadR family transcriptional regulator [Methanomassiliicoccus sp.]